MLPEEPESSPLPPVVEVTAQPVDRRAKIAIVAGVLAIALAAAVVLAFDANAIVRDEAQLWETASSTQGTQEDWQRYVDFAAGAQTGLRGTIASAMTPVSVRAPLAAENVLVASAERAGLRSDDEALCAIEDQHPATRGAELAETLVRHDQMTRLAVYATSVIALGAQPGARDALVRAASADDPCHPLGMLTMTYETEGDDLDGALPFGGATLRERIAARDRTEITEAWTRQLSDGLFATLGIPLAEDDEGGPLAIEVQSRVIAQGRFAARHGAALPGLALNARLRIHARGRPPAPLGEPAYAIAFTIVPTTSPALAIAQASNAEELEAVYARMLAELDAGLLARTRLELGLGRTYGPARANECDDLDPIALSGVVHGDTRDAYDASIGTCSSEGLEAEERSDCEECWDEDPVTNADVTYRMVLTERTRVAIQAETEDDRPMVVYVRESCGTVDDELACQELALDHTFDPGVYYVVADETEGGSGTFDLVARSRTATAITAACRDAAALTNGVTVHGDTTHASDALESACGGVGSHERVYAVDVTEPSRLRCSVTADFAVAIDLRDDCASDARTCALRNETLRAELAPGRHFVVVDGRVHDAHGTFDLTCEIVSAAGEPESAATITSPLVVDTMRARADSRGSCGFTNGPELAYRVEVTSTSHLRFSSSVPATTMYLRDATHELACREGLLDLDVAPGTYTLVVDSDAADFGARTITFTPTDLHAMCAAAPLLVTGPSAGTVVGGSTSFAGTCVGVGMESMQRLVLAVRSHVVIRAHTTFEGGLYVRRTCDRWHSEVACARTERSHALVDVTLDAGTYEVFVDALSVYAPGSYTLDVAIDPV